MERIEKLLNELALDLLMVDPATTGKALTGAEAKLTALKTITATLPKFAPFSDAIEQVLNQLKIGSNPNALTELSNFISQAQNFLRAPDSARFSGGMDPISCFGEDVSSNLDTELLIEFIEKHSTLMEEFEAALVDARFKHEAGKLSGEAAEELRAYVKGYIHNIKGDAGSIGLRGIERSSHYIEDILVDKTPENILNALIAYKEWVITCMKAYEKKCAPSQTCESFMQTFKQIAADYQPPPPTAVKPSAPASEELPPEANLALLAELMGETSLSSTNTQTIQVEAEDEPEQASSESSAPYKISGEADLLVEFAVEAEEHLGNVECVLLESGGNYDKDSIDCLFRAIHSIKGASSYFKLEEINRSSHVTENLLDEVRSGKRKIDQPLTELLLTYVDLQGNLLKQAKEAINGDLTLQRTEIYRNYMHKLNQYEKGEKYMAQETKPQSSPTTEAPGKQPVADEGDEVRASAQKSGEKLEVKTFVKVETQRLDQLIDSIGEMCIYSSMLIQTCKQRLTDDEDLARISHQVEKFSRELQNIGMSMRLIPIRGLFQKMSRLVWDTAKKIGKDIKFEMDGEDTELDRTIIDKLADPLMHMIRNALDHGIESAEERAKTSKSKTGTIKLSAFHAAGSIHIRIEDDGRGLNPEKLIKKAIEKGIISPDEKLSESEVFNLIFAAGFSTAAQVTDISGRGVGMDVVKRNIESMRGRVVIQSTVGAGSVFTIELPLTLAIMDGVEVAVGGERFIIPTLSVIEFMRPTPDMVTRTLDSGETFHFRGRYLPVFRLANLFGLAAKRENPFEALFIVVESGGEHFALMADDILGTCSCVIKNLGDVFEQGKGIAGCAVTATGDVSLILDVLSLVQMARHSYNYTRRAYDQAKGAVLLKDVAQESLPN